MAIIRTFIYNLETFSDLRWPMEPILSKSSIFLTFEKKSFLMNIFNVFDLKIKLVTLDLSALQSFISDLFVTPCMLPLYSLPPFSDLQSELWLGLLLCCLEFLGFSRYLLQNIIPIHISVISMN